MVCATQKIDVHALSIIIALLMSACWGEVEPIHPYDEESPRERQARGSVTLSIQVASNEVITEGYFELIPTRTDGELRRLFLIDFIPLGVVTSATGDQSVLFETTLQTLSPGAYAVYSFIPGYSAKTGTVFEVELGASIEVSIELVERAESSD